MLKKGLFISAMIAALCFSGSAFAASQDVTGEGVLLSPFGTELNRLDIPLDTQVLVLVEGSGLNAAVSVYKREPLYKTPETIGVREIGPGVAPIAKTPDEVLAMQKEGQSLMTGWQLILSTPEGKLGRKGLGKQVEGDEKTPIGIFKMNTPFGISDALEGFPDNYLKVDSNYYWNGDSDSPLYNKLCNVTSYNDFNKAKSEHLINYGGYYNYCIDSGYNPEGTPHLGSAIFLHCSMGENTGGCIAVPESCMIDIMKNYIEGKTYIAIGDVSDMSGLYKAQ